MQSEMDLHDLKMKPKTQHYAFLLDNKEKAQEVEGEEEGEENLNSSSSSSSSRRCKMQRVLFKDLKMKYTLDNVVHAGQHSKIYKATRTSDNTTFALKRIGKSMLNKKETFQLVQLLETVATRLKKYSTTSSAKSLFCGIEELFLTDKDDIMIILEWVPVEKMSSLAQIGLERDLLSSLTSIKTPTAIPSFPTSSSSSSSTKEKEKANLLLESTTTNQDEQEGEREAQEGQEGFFSETFVLSLSRQIVEALCLIHLEVGVTRSFLSQDHILVNVQKEEGEESENTTGRNGSEFVESVKLIDFGLSSFLSRTISVQMHAHTAAKSDYVLCPPESAVSGVFAGDAIEEEGEIEKEAQIYHDEKKGTENMSKEEVAERKKKMDENRRQVLSEELWKLGVVLYHTLTGKMPGMDSPGASNLFTIVQNIIAGKITPIPPSFASQECRNFIFNQLLQADPKKRISIEEVLKNKWLVSSAGVKKNSKNNKNKEWIQHERFRSLVHEKKYQQIGRKLLLLREKSKSRIRDAFQLFVPTQVVCRFLSYDLCL